MQLLSALRTPSLNTYFDFGMTSNSWFSRLAGILALIIVGPTEAKGFGGMVSFVMDIFYVVG